MNLTVWSSSLGRKTKCQPTIIVVKHVLMSLTKSNPWWMILSPRVQSAKEVLCESFNLLEFNLKGPGFTWTIKTRHLTLVSKQFQICVFDDHHGLKLTTYQLTRPTYTIPMGMTNLEEKLHGYNKSTPITLICDPSHDALLKTRFQQLSLNQLNRSLPTLSH